MDGGSTQNFLDGGRAGFAAAAVLRQEADQTVHAVVVGTYPDDTSFSFVVDQSRRTQLVLMGRKRGGGQIQRVA